MPDDDVTTGTDDAAPAAPAADAAPSTDERLAALERKLAESTAREQAYAETLRALGQGRGQDDRPSAPAAYTPPGAIPAESLARLRHATGWKDEEIQAHYPVIAAYLAEIAAPILNQILPNMADRIDYLDTRADVPEYMDLRDEVEAERKARVARGEFLSRKELTRLVKARRMDDPAHLDKLLAERAEQAAARAASAAAAATESGTVQRPGQRSQAPLTREQLAAMKPKDLEKALDGVQF